MTASRRHPPPVRANAALPTGNGPRRESTEVSAITCAARFRYGVAVEPAVCSPGRRGGLKPSGDGPRMATSAGVGGRTRGGRWSSGAPQREVAETGDPRAVATFFLTLISLMTGSGLRPRARWTCRWPRAPGPAASCYTYGCQQAFLITKPLPRYRSLGAASGSTGGEIRLDLDQRQDVGILLRHVVEVDRVRSLGPVENALLDHSHP